MIKGIFEIENGWLRMFSGHGISWKDVSKHPLLFSERMNYRKKVMVGRWCVTYLKPNY